jgi:hypothetical protein
MRRVLLALAVVLALPAATEAAPPWAAPEDVSRPHTFIDGLWIGTHLTFGWRSEDGERGAPAGRVGEPTFYGWDEGAAAIVRPVGSNRDPRSELRVAFLRPGGAFGRSQRVVERPGIASPVVAGNARGNLALAWFEDRGARNDHVYVALQRRGRPVGRPLRLATGRVRSVSVALGARGDVLVAWDARGTIRTRLRRSGRRSFGRAETLRSDPAFSAKLRTAVAASGRAVVAWTAQRQTEGGERGPGYYEAALRPAGARRFGRAQRLERIGAGRPVGSLDLELAGAGRAVVAWTSGRVRVAETGADERFGAPRDLSAPGAGLAEFGTVDVLASSTGWRLVTWTAAGPRVQAAVAPVGAGFGPPEDVAPGEGARAGFPGPTLVWQVRRADGVVVQRASRSG